jgi:hypothetical protein
MKAAFLLRLRTIVLRGGGRQLARFELRELEGEVKAAETAPKLQKYDDFLYNSLGRCLNDSQAIWVPCAATIRLETAT